MLDADNNEVQSSPDSSDTRARAEELDAVINQMADGLMIFGKDGLLRRINPAGSRLLGRGLIADSYPARRSEEYQLYSLSGELFPGDQLPSVKALAGETVSGVQMLVKRPEGGEVIVSASAS